MEKAAIQLCSTNLTMLDGFIEAVCEEHHLDNYYATISVAVTKAVEYAMDKGSDVMDLSFGHYNKGIYFKLKSPREVFATLPRETTDMTLSSEGECSVLITTLSDQVQVLDNGDTLQVMFAVQGIDSSECVNRIAILEKFYQLVRVESLSNMSHVAAC